MQWNMSPAKPADLQTPNSTREKTDCTSSPATPVVLDDPSRQSRLVSLPKSAREEDSRVRAMAGCWTWHYEVSQGSGRIFSIAWAYGIVLHLEVLRRE
jgi:hypothetical protein